ncbi:MAG TPA: DUF2806 domain-containing protein [Polyangiaceae bacterium]
MHPLLKLLDVCERRIGVSARVWFQRHNSKTPTDAQIRDADARELEAARVAPLIQNEGSFPPLHHRVMRRLTYQEGKRQLNIEDIIEEALRILVHEQTASDDAVDEDWSIRFFAIAQDVSYEPMKRLWGRLLAAEVRRPGSFSLRCLESVRSIARSEADALSRIAPFVVNGEAILRAPDVGELLKMGEFHALVDAGVVSPNILQWEMPAPDARVRLPDLLVQLRGGQPMVVDAWRLTSVGVELIPLLNAKANRAFVRWLIEEVNARDYRWTLHRMVSREPPKWDPRPSGLHEI